MTHRRTARFQLAAPIAGLVARVTMSSMEPSSALLAAGRPHEVLLLPGIGHQAMSWPLAENMLWHQVRFLQRHLSASRPDPEGR